MCLDASRDDTAARAATILLTPRPEPGRLQAIGAPYCGYCIHRLRSSVRDRARRCPHGRAPEAWSRVGRALLRPDNPEAPARRGQAGSASTQLGEVDSPRSDTARSDCWAVTTVTGSPNCSTRWGRSRRSQCDTRAGSVETIISSMPSLVTVSRTATNGSVSPIIPSTWPPAASSSSGIASSNVAPASSVSGSQ